METAEKLNTFADQVQYASNWRESMVELAQTLRAGLDAQAVAIAALEAAAAAPAAAPAEAAPAEAAPAEAAPAEAAPAEPAAPEAPAV